MEFEDIKSFVETEIPEAILGEDVSSNPKTLHIDSSHLLAVCKLLYANQQTYFDSLSCLTGIDNGSEAGSMEVVYHLYSIPYNIHLALKVTLDRSDPVVDSVTTIWQTANWHERETYDLLGIRFEGHPDLRRILMPDDWQGYPLRKDYVEQEMYHNLKVKY